MGICKPQPAWGGRRGVIRATSKMWGSKCGSSIRRILGSVASEFRDGRTAAHKPHSTLMRERCCEQWRRIFYIRDPPDWVVGDKVIIRSCFKDERSN